MDAFSVDPAAVLQLAADLDAVAAELAGATVAVPPDAGAGLLGPALHRFSTRWRHGLQAAGAAAGAAAGQLRGAAHAYLDVDGAVAGACR